MSLTPSAQRIGNEAGQERERLVDLDGDGRLDRLQVGARGSFVVALNRGGRRFEPVAQDLPALGPTVPSIASVLVGDLDGDGFEDLYLVSKGPNVALVNDGAGRFRDATVELGLEDDGRGRSAERVDVDADGLADLLLHDERGDVLFWANRVGTFERDGSVPVSSPQPLVAPTSCLSRIQDATTGSCLRANTTPSLDSLYPLSPFFNVDPAGNIGIGTTSPAARVHVEGGSLRVDDGDVSVFDGSTRTIALDAADGASGSGGQILLSNGSGTETLQLDANAAGSGNAFIGIRNDAGTSGASLSANGTNGAGELRVNDGLGELAALLRGERSGLPGGSQLFLLDGGVSAVQMNARHPDATAARGQILLRDDSDDVTVELEAGEANNGGALRLFSQTSPDTPNTQPAIELSAGLAYGLDITDPEVRLRFPDSGNDAVFINGLQPSVWMYGPDGEIVRFGGAFVFGTPMPAFWFMRYRNSVQAARFWATQEASKTFREVDGSRAMKFSADDLRLFDSSDASTVYFDRQTATKSAVISTPSHGQRLFYALEGTEVWLEDIGWSRLEHGEARIELDPTFLEAVTIDGANPMRVLVTTHGPSRGVYVERDGAGFTVRENGGGESSAPFGWRVMAKRRGVESLRLDPFTDG